MGRTEVVTEPRRHRSRELERERPVDRDGLAERHRIRRAHVAHRRDGVGQARPGGEEEIECSCRRTVPAREMIDLRNRGEKLSNQADQMLKEYGDKMEPEEKESLQGQAAALRSAIASDRFHPAQEACQSLEEAMRRVGESLYRNSSQPSDEGTEVEDNSSDETGG